jgi:hypothetical protein
MLNILGSNSTVTTVVCSNDENKDQQQDIPINSPVEEKKHTEKSVSPTKQKIS